MLPVMRRPNFLFTVWLLNFLGIGLRGRSVIHWFLFAFVIIWTTCLLFSLFKNFRMYLTHLSDILFTLSCLFQILLLVKRTKLLRELLSHSHKLSRRNHIMFRVTDAVVFIVVMIQLISDVYSFGWRGCHAWSRLRFLFFDNKSILANITVSIVCVEGYILLRCSDMFCGLYLLIFVIIYLIKVQHLEKISKGESSRWKEQIWLFSPQVSALHENLEESCSSVLFNRTVIQFTSILTLLPVLIDNIRTRYDLGLRGAIYGTFGYCHNIFVTVSLLLSISLMQEDIERRCKCLSEQMLLDTFSGRTVQESWVIQKVLKSNFTRKVTIGNMAQVSRGTIISLASTYVVFSILFWQINNGALAPSNKSS